MDRKAASTGCTDMRSRSTIQTLMDMVPGKRRFGMYRFLPFFFVLGGAMEWFMINVRIGKETFYDVYRRRQSERMCEQRAFLQQIANSNTSQSKNHD